MKIINSIDEKYKPFFYVIIVMIITILFMIGYDLKYNYKSLKDIEELTIKLHTLSTYIKENNCMAPNVKKVQFKTVRGTIFDGVYNYVDGNKYTGRRSDVLYYFEFDKPVNYICKLGGKNVQSHYYRDSWGYYNHVEKYDISLKAQEYINLID